MVLPWYEFELFVPVELAPPQAASATASAIAIPRATVLIELSPSFPIRESAHSLAGIEVGELALALARRLDPGRRRRPAGHRPGQPAPRNSAAIPEKPRGCLGDGPPDLLRACRLHRPGRTGICCSLAAIPDRSGKRPAARPASEHLPGNLLAAAGADPALLLPG